MRVRRSLLNFGTSVLFLGVTMIVALKVKPLLVGWLGTKRFGGSRVVFDCLGWLTLLELGLGGAMGPLLARAVGEKDDRTLRQTVATGARAYLGVSLMTVLVGLLATPLIPRFARDLGGEDVADLKQAWFVGLASFLSLAFLPMRWVVEARQLGYVVNLLMLGQSLLITGLSLALAWAGRGMTGQAAAQVIGVWTFSLALAVGVLRANPGMFRAVLTEPTSAEARGALWKLSLPTLTINLSGRLGLLTDNLMVGGIRGTVNVTSLVNTQQLTSIGQGVLQGAGGATWAALAELHHQGDHSTFNRRLIEITRAVAVLGIIGLVPIVAYNRAFVRLWLGADLYAGDAVTILAAVNTLLLAEQSLWAWCFNATGKVRELVAPALSAAVLNVSVSVWLTYRLGTVGPLIGTTVGFVAVGLWALPVRLNRAFGTPTGPLFRAVGWPCALGAVAASALRAWTTRHEPAGWLDLVSEMSLSALVMLALSVMFLIPRRDRTAWKQHLLALVPDRRRDPDS